MSVFSRGSVGSNFVLSTIVWASLLDADILHTNNDWQWTSDHLDSS
jgi:hypothetical protein